MNNNGDAKLLIVEDDYFYARRIEETLQDCGLASETVGSVEEALRHDLSLYSGAIVDVMLPNNPEESGISVEETRGGFLSGVALSRKIRERFAELPIILISSEVASNEGRLWAKNNNCSYVAKHDGPQRLKAALLENGLIMDVPQPRSFIVHGHDEVLLLEMKNYLQNTLKWPEPIILREKPNCGRTIIEKFEDYAIGVEWVFVLISPDDVDFSPVNDEERRRARQNVIFECGFFYGLLRRYDGHVIVLKKGEVELPSDTQGIVWIDVSAGVHAAGECIRREIEAIEHQ